MSKEQIALVTGASRGIGKAIAVALAEQGIIVVGTATTTAGADAITNYLKQAGQLGAGYCLDLTEVEQIAPCLERIVAEFGAPTILINNAGITDDNLLLRMRKEQWDDVIATNLSSVYHLTKLCLKNMVKKRWGRIINVSSVVAYSGNPGQSNYCAAKAGMIGFSKAIALEYASCAITSNTVAPGFIATDMISSLTTEQTDKILEQIPMKKMGEAKDVAAAVVFLASAQAQYITGQTLHINGGMWIG